MKFGVFLGWAVGVSGCVDGSKKILQNFGFCSALMADLSAQRQAVESAGIELVWLNSKRRFCQDDILLDYLQRVL